MLGQYEEALSHYNYGVAKNPEYGDIYFHRGLAYVSLTNFKQGIEDFNLAREKPTQGEVNKFRILLNLGINLRRVNELSKSIEILKKAIEIQPNKAQAHNNLGLSYYESGDWEEALTSYTKAINIEGQGTGELGGSKEYLSLYMNNRGLAHYHTRNYEDAMKDYNDAITAVSGSNPENFFNRGNVFLNLEQFE